MGVLFITQYVSTILPTSSLGLAKISIIIIKKNNKLIFSLIKFIKGVYLITTSILCMLSLLGNVYVLNLHGRDIRIEKDMPKWVILFY